MIFSMRDNTAIFNAEFNRKLERALEMCGLVAEGYAVDECPVDTGHKYDPPNLEGRSTYRNA